ncbi:hypothetical protein [Streptomyces mirabilis]|uniref:hypothetical protein n=1 Tax=Streptomyces mirabilis TaxID=68239 RepID=UPI002E372CDC|nr:hypothetical protein [Streptomyces mirabilis]
MDIEFDECELMTDSHGPAQGKQVSTTFKTAAVDALALGSPAVAAGSQVHAAPSTSHSAPDDESVRAQKADAVPQKPEAPWITPRGLWSGVHSAGFEPATF